MGFLGLGLVFVFAFRVVFGAFVFARIVAVLAVGRIVLRRLRIRIVIAARFVRCRRLLGRNRICVAFGQPREDRIVGRKMRRARRFGLERETRRRGRLRVAPTEIRLVAILSRMITIRAILK